MAAKKVPTPRPRRTTRKDSKQPLTAEQKRKIDAAARRREQGKADESPAVEGRGIVAMKGRLLADGTRRGAAVKRRTTLYLPLAVADELDARARSGRSSLSDVAAETLAEAWAIELEAAS